MISKRYHINIRMISEYREEYQIGKQMVSVWFQSGFEMIKAFVCVVFLPYESQLLCIDVISDIVHL